MLLVYTHKITPRLTYAFKHICTRILGIPVKFTTTIEDFITHDSMKMSYAKQPLSNEVFVRSNELLFEIGLSDIDINVHDWDDTKCFFNTSEKRTCEEKSCFFFVDIPSQLQILTHMRNRGQFLYPMKIRQRIPATFFCGKF